MVTKVKDEDIHIGDVLRVRQWEDMVSEYGMTDDEDYYYCAIKLNNDVKFLKKMAHLCGQVFTVSEDYDYEFNDTKIKFYRSKEGVWSLAYLCRNVRAFHRRGFRSSK